MPLLLSAKILTTFFTIMMLASVARRLGPGSAGVLAGFPLGSAITLYFIGYEQGTLFAAEGAKHTLVGLIACLLMAVIYWHVSQRWPKPWQIFLPLLAAPLSFFCCIWILQWLPAERWLNLILITTAILLARKMMLLIPNSQAERQLGNIWQRPVVAIVFRATMATMSVLGITGLAHYVTPEQAGLLAAFPVSFFPTLIILQLSYGPTVVATTVRQYPDGLGAMVVYVLTVSYSYQYPGLNQGTLAALSAAITYLILYTLWRRSR